MDRQRLLTAPAGPRIRVPVGPLSTAKSSDLEGVLAMPVWIEPPPVVTVPRMLPQEPTTQSEAGLAIDLAFGPHEKSLFAGRRSKPLHPRLADGWIFRSAAATLLAVGIIFGTFHHDLPSPVSNSSPSSKSSESSHLLAHHAPVSNTSTRVK
jgi:hypothetical protein